MFLLGSALIAFAGLALLVQITSIGLAILRCREGRSRTSPASRPPITLVRPLCGLEYFSRETLRSTFTIEYPDYEVLLCVADAADPIVPLAQAAMAEHPGCNARLLIGHDAFSANPKLNNVAKGFREARFKHIVFVDSNVLTPPDYLDQLAAALQAGVGMVSAPPVGHAPQGFWAELECAFLNSYQARMQYAVDTLGMGFAQGKTLFFRRADLEHGGFAQLASEPAEDAAATKMMRARSRRIGLAGPFPQLIGPRSLSAVWNRQLRWARLRRASFPLIFTPELLAGGLPPLLALTAGLQCLGQDGPGAAMATFCGLWYGSELLLLRLAGWPFSLIAIFIRDLMLPVVFIAGCCGSNFEWHGQAMTVAGRSHAGSRLGRMHPKLLWTKFASRHFGS